MTYLVMILLQFDNDSWPAYVPMRLPEAISITKRVPPGAVAVLINQAHGYPDLILPVGAHEMRMVEVINGERTIDEIIHQVSPTGAKNLNKSGTR